MPRTFGQPQYDMAKEWMEDHREMFPPRDFDALVTQVARDLQGVLEDATNPDFLDINLKHLRRMQEVIK